MLNQVEMKPSRGRGRPLSGETVMEHTIPVRLPAELLEEIDKARQELWPAVPSRSQLMRELLVIGLRARRPQPLK